jgi:hypothetical protein
MGRQRQGSDYQFGGDYLVFVRRNGEPVPIYIRTGLTDLDYSEVVSGLGEKDSVLILPSASLVRSQEESRNRAAQFGGGGLVPGTQQPQTTGRTGGGGGPGRP